MAPGPEKRPASPVRIAIKAVPGAKRDEIVGRLGDRLKVRIAAPPEAGRANEAICELLAAALGIPTRQVRIVSGHTRPEKTAEITGASVAAVQGLFGSG